MTDLGPHKKKIAQLLRMLGSSGGERRNAFAALERTMRGAGVSWTDIGDVLELERDEGKYSEGELQEYGQAMRAEGVEAGIQVGMARKNNGGAGVLPSTAVMAEHCHGRPSRLKDDAQREFIEEMYERTQRGKNNLKLGTLGYLASIYIKLGGRI